jgi:hypothetical protein
MSLGLGQLLYLIVLLLNSIAILNPDRFLARIGLIGNAEEEGVRGKVVQLVGAVRTLMRSK